MFCLDSSTWNTKNLEIFWSEITLLCSKLAALAFNLHFVISPQGHREGKQNIPNVLYGFHIIWHHLLPLQTWGYFMLFTGSHYSIISP
jgi:hypothetical protein